MHARSPIQAAFGLYLGFSLAALTACGTPQPTGESQRSLGQRSSDARTPGDSGGAEAGQGAQPGTDGEQDPLDCGGIMLHEGHDECDGDDVVAAGDGAGEGVADSGQDVPGGDDVDDGATVGDDAAAPPVPPTPAVPPADPNIVMFRIKAGTGTSPWNDAAGIVTVKIGQTLRILNDDTVTHRLHTNGAPCAHGGNFAPGAAFDCVIAVAFDSTTNPGGLYDHIGGPTARFYVKATP